MADNNKGEMIRGQIDTVILLALVDGDKDSNDIRVFIEEKSDNQYSIKQGTFYSAMQRLVKQNLIKEYRSSAIDGIRRKYYNLTAKGSKYLEKNREQWSASKALVDNLIDAEPALAPVKPVEAPKPEPAQVDEFESFKAFAQNSVDDFTVETYDEEDDLAYFDKLGESVLNDVNEELNKLKAEEETAPPKQEIIEPAQIETVEKIEDNIENSLDNYDNLSNMTKDELFDFELVEEEIPEPVEEPSIVKDSPSETRVQSEIEGQKEPEVLPIKAEESVKNQPVKNEPIDEIDDHLILEDSVPTNRHDYKRLLNKFIPTEKPVEKVEKPVETPKPEKVEVALAPIEPVMQEPKKEQPAQPVIPTVDGTDFSDLYAMAEREGFKIKTSYNTNKYLGNQILLNKLNLHGSFLFFILILLEALVLNFALGTILNWDISVKLIILGCLTAFPLVCLLFYILSPKRVVPEISSFKDAIGIALLITIQASILIVCVALFMSVDFNNFKELTTFIVLPFILALNIPLYFILKYALLSTGKYFTE